MELREGVVDASATPSWLTLQSWVFEEVDSFRQKPFRRYIHPEFYVRGYPNRAGWQSGEHTAIYEVVDCPEDVAKQQHILQVWKPYFPKLAAWFKDNKERRPYFYQYGGILFRKADW